jgi:hypothetical protein
MAVGAVVRRPHPEEETPMPKVDWRYNRGG